MRSIRFGVETDLTGERVAVPNFFITPGPFGAAGNQSALYMIESQIAYIVDALRCAVRPPSGSPGDRPRTRHGPASTWCVGGCRGHRRRCVTRLADDLGERVFPVTADVSDRHAMLAAIDLIVARYGRLDIVVANAGVVRSAVRRRSGATQSAGWCTNCRERAAP
ncbi:SDR family oxidoreductase [Nocardia thraciensis]